MWAADPVEEEATDAEPVAVPEPEAEAEPEPEAVREAEAEVPEPDWEAEPEALDPEAVAALVVVRTTETAKVEELSAVMTKVLVGMVPLPPKYKEVTPVKPAGTRATAG